MRIPIPLTAPNFPEFIELMPEKRELVLKEFAASKDTAGILGRTKTALLVGILFAILGLIVPDILPVSLGAAISAKWMALGCWVVAAAMVIFAVIYYRTSSRRVLQEIIAAQSRTP